MQTWPILAIVHMLEIEVRSLCLLLVEPAILDGQFGEFPAVWLMAETHRNRRHAGFRGPLVG